MKPSRYNIFLLLKDGDFVMYNCLSDRVARIDEEMRTAIEEGTIEDEELQEAMKEMGFIVEDDIDEIKIVKSRRKEGIARSFCHTLGLTFIMTYGCNLACTYCYEAEVRTQGSMLDADSIDTLTEFVKNRIHAKPAMMKLAYRFYGGEPLLNWKGCQRILEQTEKILENNNIMKDFQMVTNATLFTDTIIETLSTYGVKDLQITLDGCKEDHDQRRITPSGEGTYELIVENIGKTMDGGLDPEIRINLDEENHKNVGKLFDDLKERGLDKARLYFGIITGMEIHCPSDRVSALDPSILSDVVPRAWQEAEKRGIEMELDYQSTPVSCQFDLLDHYIVDPYLDVYKCWDLIGMKEHVVGKIQDGIFHPNFLYYDYTTREPTEFEGCKDCDVLPVCKGGCAARAINTFGTVHAAGCFKDRYLTEQRLRRYILKKLGVSL